MIFESSENFSNKPNLADKSINWQPSLDKMNLMNLKSC